jgi:TrbL/VirB6 plasmid conjugal transfer protein
MRTPRRFPHRMMLVLAVLAVLVGLPRAAQAVAGLTAPAHPVAASPAAAHTGPARNAAVVTLAERQPAAPAGGACSVPGIGDIASLLGFCTLGQSGLTGDLNNICQPSLPDPEPANSGIDAMVKPPAEPGRQPSTLYGSYGVAGQYWAATNLQCSDMTSLIGNNVASMVFDIAKSIDRVTITIYQAAAGEGILSWLTSVVDKLVSSLGNAIYFPYLSAVVLIGAIWLAWQGLIRKRGTRTIEGTIWMVVACVAAIWLISRPADFTGMGTAVTDGVSQSLNTAFAKLPAPSQSNCVPVGTKDPQVQPGSFTSPSSSALVAENANELWTVLVCKPWLAGEFGTFSTGGAQSPVNAYGRQLLWAQAIATNETPSTSLIQAKQATYAGIATSIQQHDPGIYPLFQGKQWTTRLEIAFAALFAAAIAGVLVLLIAVTLILLKLGFLLLLVVGPFFLLIGTHPGFGRVVALRWFEMLVGVLLKQAAVALVLSVLLYAYSLIMGTSDATLPWALKILMIALVTVAAFIYRRPFQHLFSAVGYGMIGSTERAEIEVERHRAALRQNALVAAAAVVPGVAAYRAARWARRNPAAAAAMAGTGGVGAAAAAGLQAGENAGEDGAAGDGAAAGTGIAPAEGGTRAGSRSGLASRARAWAGAAAGDGAGRSAPPLNLPSRQNGAAGRAGGAPGGGTPPSGRTASDAAAAARPGQPGTVRQGGVRPGPARQGPVRQGAAPSAPAQAGSARPGPAPSGAPAPGPAGSRWPRSGWAPGGQAAPASPRSAPPRPAVIPPGQPARSQGPPPAAPAGSAPASPAPGPAPARPAGSRSPWRPGGTPRQPSAGGRGQGGPWAGQRARARRRSGPAAGRPARRSARRGPGTVLDAPDAAPEVAGDGADGRPAQGGLRTDRRGPSRPGRLRARARGARRHPVGRVALPGAAPRGERGPAAGRHPRR